MDIKVYEAISKVQGALAKAGISKDQKNAQQGFKYRGIDDVYNTLAPFLAENKLTILPRMMGKEVTEKASKSGGVLTYTTVTAEFDLVSAEDGSKHTVSAYGEAMDSGDKSIGKAMSYAYKAMAFMTFAIPTDGDNDPDAHTHEVVQTPTSAPTTQPSASGNASKCAKCGAGMLVSKTKGTEYCSALCWKNPKQETPTVQSDDVALADIPF